MRKNLQDILYIELKSVLTVLCSETEIIANTHAKWAHQMHSGPFCPFSAHENVVILPIELI